MDKNKKKEIMKKLISSKGMGGPGSGGAGQYAIDDPSKAEANMDNGEMKYVKGKKDGMGGPGYAPQTPFGKAKLPKVEMKGKGGPGDATSPMNPSMSAIPGLDNPMSQDPTMGGTVSPMGSSPITAGNPAGAPAPGAAPSLPSTMAPLPKLRAGVGRTLTPSRFSGVRSSAKMTKKSPGAQKGAMTKASKKASLKGAVRKSAGTKGKSAGPMSSMAKMSSFK